MRKKVFILIVLLLFFCRSALARTFWVATDLHYISPRLNDHGASFEATVKAGDGKMTMYCEELADTLISEVLAERPDALILTGDLSFNGAIESHEDLIIKLRTVLDAGIPVLVIPGNHDTAYPYAVRFTGKTYEHVASPTAREFGEMYHDFGPAQAISCAPDSFSYVYEAGNGLRLMLLDTAAALSCAVTKDTFTWAVQMLEDAKRDGCRMITFSHQNLLEHHAMFTRGYRFAGADELLEAFREAGNVICHFSGHTHLQHIAGDDIPEVITSSLSVWPCQMGVITTDENGLHYQTRQPDVAAWAAANDRPELSDFPQQALSFFEELSVRKLMNALPQGEDADRRALLGNTLAELNKHFFGGIRLDTNALAEGIAAWEGEPESFVKMYALSITQDPIIKRDYRTLDIPFAE